MSTGSGCFRKIMYSSFLCQSIFTSVLQQSLIKSNDSHNFYVTENSFTTGINWYSPEPPGVNASSPFAVKSQKIHPNHRSHAKGNNGRSPERSRAVTSRQGNKHAYGASRLVCFALLRRFPIYVLDKALNTVQHDTAVVSRFEYRFFEQLKLWIYVKSLN